MSDGAAELAAARIEAERSRARLTATAKSLHDRLRLDVLMRQGVDRLRTRSGEIADDAIEAARARPALVGGVGAGVLLLYLRRPIARLGRRLFLRKDETDRATGRLNDGD